VQFTRTASGFTPRSTEVATLERPPMASIPEYQAAGQAHQARQSRQAPSAPQAQGRASGRKVCPHP
jgi:glucosyl-3-phosphoglycerate synthase